MIARTAAKAAREDARMAAKVYALAATAATLANIRR
jgi:hypothetical protein